LKWTTQRLRSFGRKYIFFWKISDRKVHQCQCDKVVEKREHFKHFTKSETSLFNMLYCRGTEMSRNQHNDKSTTCYNSRPCLTLQHNTDQQQRRLCRKHRHNITVTVPCLVVGPHEIRCGRTKFFIIKKLSIFILLLTFVVLICVGKTLVFHLLLTSGMHLCLIRNRHTRNAWRVLMMTVMLTHKNFYRVRQ